jgi:hypothetical protein
MFPPNDVLFAETKGGVLTARPLAETVPAEPSNHIQHLLFGWRQRLIAALMHECVLVPEGPSDVSWLETLQRELELRQEWQDEEKDGTRFGTFVGVVPTNDAKIVDTLSVVQGVHTNAAVVLDGDAEGWTYLEQVRTCATPPKVVMLWPDGWKMESVIGWLAEADKATLITELGAALSWVFKETSEFVEYLVARKMYVPTHEAVGAVLIANKACHARTAELLGAIADVLQGKDAALFEHLPGESTGATQVFRLKP